MSELELKSKEFEKGLVLELNTYKDYLKGLLTPTKEYKFSDHTPEETKHLAENIIAALYKEKGLGIAANQLYLDYSVFAFRGIDVDYALFNPKVVQEGSEKIKLEEACLSWPALVVPMVRAKHLLVQFYDVEGQLCQQEFTGMTARVFQHELTHLQGKHWFEGCSRFHLQRSIKQAMSKGFDYSGMGLMKFCRREK